MPTSKSASAAKRRRLTLAQLAAYDDILTDALVDHVFYWTSVPKNRSSYHPSRGIREQVIAGIIQQEVVVNRSLEAAERKLLATDGLRRFHDGLKTDQERDDFRRHLLRYLQIYLPDCPWEVGSTNRYTIVTHEACVTARRPIRRNETVRYLSGIQVNITPEEEKDIAVRKKDFSIVVSSRNKCTSLFMGPARFANHDCGANARLMTTGHAGIEIIATRAIDPGEEITVSYGENYFGEDNCECLCRTCEKNLCNGWTPEHVAAPAVEATVEGVDEGLDEEKTESYSLRRRLRDGSSAGAASSRTPSVAPLIRPRIYKTRIRTPRRGHAKASWSAATSPAPDADSPRGRKRSAGAMVTPPVTPAKRLRSLAESLTAQGVTSSGSSSSGSASSINGDAMETDFTSPDKETPEPSAEKPMESDAPRAMKREESDAAHSPPLSQESVASASSEAAVALATTPVVSVPHSPPSDKPTAPAPVVIVSSIEAVDEGQEAQATGEGEQIVRRRKYQRRVFIKQTTPPARMRTPGDYVLTPLLLSEPEMAWIQCSNCSAYFVQQNAYFTRSSCPRCERHSKLYGYLWPKTDKVGPSDKEERVLDHRTVHRFLDSHEERKARGRKSFDRDGTCEADQSDDEPRGRDPARGPASSAKQAARKGHKAKMEHERADGVAPRRSGRARRTSCKLAE
ncbi:SET domain-containing protein [Hirsutella rhossiliensis]|uniref:Histone-lysine N-methyltransferase SET9 n=1 Tax=Hirsutella rhossiliensis TaxID=111463 RepID=A0A9P8N308_9HYPO|nr:SET domain-containing protein [Hirsutella rhossiliensis]KAH0965987.1 SET domain-containing protein [Hirsutella rhossiliensis]